MIFSIGGVAYALLEILWRRKTHWTMAVTGGSCFLAIFRVYKKFPKLCLRSKCLIGGAIITFMEGICGFIVNVKCKLNVWDYSNCTLNFKGQICPFYSMLWILLCIPISGICKLLCKNKKIV
ncbi:hypothetical protein DXC23_08465 [Eubacterium sp. OM08-24]|uniref:putative ABC transporter permease n=1 Tax=Eubacterium sp. OM08-24 TaxID=2292352 RepID=UPI000E44EA09|nr:hypothetical protein [Eubacterium sp. OM08-24]RGM19305.1 hypothetical protein DXC23_08465 [Eubacterium sp. OM08-24]